MRIQPTTSVCCLLLLLFPIAALAADAASPTAPAVQSAVWTAEDYLRAALSGAAGGLISGLVAFVIGWMSNRNALKINKQKIDADRAAQILSQEHQFEKLCYADKKNICFKFINYMTPEKIIKNDYAIDDVKHLLFEMRIVLDENYHNIARELFSYITNRDYFLYYSVCPNDNFTYEEVREKSEQLFRVSYRKKYDELTRLTRSLLHYEPDTALLTASN